MLRPLTYRLTYARNLQYTWIYANNWSWPSRTTQYISTMFEVIATSKWSLLFSPQVLTDVISNHVSSPRGRPTKMHLNPNGIIQLHSHHQISPAATVYSQCQVILEPMSFHKELLDIGCYWLIYKMQRVSGMPPTIRGYEPAALPFL